MKDILPAVDNDRMAGIVPPLVSGNDVEVGRQKIDNLPLALISPLSTYDNQVCHICPHQAGKIHGRRWTGAQFDPEERRRTARRPASANRAERRPRRRSWRDAPTSLQVIVNHLGDRVLGRIPHDLFLDNAVLEEK